MPHERESSVCVVVGSCRSSSATQGGPSLRRPVVFFLCVVLPSSTGSAATQCARSLRRPVVLFVGVCLRLLYAGPLCFFSAVPLFYRSSRGFSFPREAWPDAGSAHTGVPAHLRVQRPLERPQRCPGPFAGASPAGRTPTPMARPICGCIARWKNAHTDVPAHLRVHRPLEPGVSSSIRSWT